MDEQSIVQGGNCFSNGFQTIKALSKRPAVNEACFAAIDHGTPVRPRFEMIQKMIKQRQTTNAYNTFRHSGPLKQMPSLTDKQFTCAPVQQSFSASEKGFATAAAKKQWAGEQIDPSRKRQDYSSSTCSLSNQTGIGQANGPSSSCGQDLQMQNTRYYGNSMTKFNAPLEYYRPPQQRPPLPYPQRRDVSEFSHNLGLHSLHQPSPSNPGDPQQFGITSYSNPVPHQQLQDFQQSMFAAVQHLQQHQQQPPLMTNTSSGARNRYISPQDPLSAHYELSNQDRVEQELRGQLRAYEEEIHRLKKDNPFSMVMDSINLLQNVLREQQKHQHFLGEDNILQRALQLLGSATRAQNGVGTDTLSSPLARDQAQLLAPSAAGLSTSKLDSVLREGGDIRRRLAAGAKISREILRKYTAACQEMMLPFNLERLVSLASELERLQESSEEEDLAAITPPAGAGLDFMHQLRQAIAWKVKYEAAQHKVAVASERVVSVHSLYASSLQTARLLPPPPLTTTSKDLSSPDLVSSLGHCFAGEDDTIDSASVVKQCTQILLMSSHEKKSPSQKRSSKNGGQSCSGEGAERLVLEHHKRTQDSATTNGCFESSSTHRDAVKQVTLDNGSFSVVRGQEEGVESSFISPTPSPADAKVLLGLLLSELEKCSWKTRRVQLHDALALELEHAKKSIMAHRAVRCAMEEVQRRIDKIHKVEEIVLFIDTRQLLEQQPQSDVSGRLSLLDFVSRSQNSVPDHVKGAVVGDVLRELQDFHCCSGSAAYKLVHPGNIVVENCFKLRQVTHATNIEPLPPWRFLAPEHRGAHEDRVAVDTKTLSSSSTTEPSGEPAASRIISGGAADIYSLGQVVLWLSCLGRPTESLSESLMLSYDEIPVLKDMLSSDPSKRPTIESLLQYRWFGSDVMDQTIVLKEKEATFMTHDRESPAAEDGELKRCSTKQNKSENTFNKSSTGKTVNGYRVITNTGLGHIDSHTGDNCEDDSEAVGLNAGPAASVPCEPEFVSEGYRVKIREEEEAIMNEMFSDDNDDNAELSQQNSSANGVITEKRICEVKTVDARDSEAGDNKQQELEGIVTEIENLEASSDPPFAPLSDTAQLAYQASSLADKSTCAPPINSHPAATQMNLSVSSAAATQVNTSVSAAPALSRLSENQHAANKASHDIACTMLLAERSAVPRVEVCINTPRPVIGQCVNQLDSFELNDDMSILEDLEDSLTESCVDDGPEEVREEPNQTQVCETALAMERSEGTAMPVVEQCVASKIVADSHVTIIDEPNIFGNARSFFFGRVGSCKSTIDRQHEVVCTNQDDCLRPDASVSVTDTAYQVGGGQVLIDQSQKDGSADRRHLDKKSTVVALPSIDNSTGGTLINVSGKQLVKCPLGRPALGSLCHGSSPNPAQNKLFVPERVLRQQPLETSNVNTRINLGKTRAAPSTANVRSRDTGYVNEEIGHRNASFGFDSLSASLGETSGNDPLSASGGEPSSYDPLSASGGEPSSYDPLSASGGETPGYGPLSASGGEPPGYEQSSVSGYVASLDCEKQFDSYVNDPIEHSVDCHDDIVVDYSQSQSNSSNLNRSGVDNDKTSGPDVGQFSWSGEHQYESTGDGGDFVSHRHQDNSENDSSDVARFFNRKAGGRGQYDNDGGGHSVDAGKSPQIETSGHERHFDVGEDCQAKTGVGVFGVWGNSQIESGVHGGSFDDQFGGVQFSMTGQEALQEEEDILLEMEDDDDHPSAEPLASGDPDEILLILDVSSN